MYSPGRQILLVLFLAVSVTCPMLGSARVSSTEAKAWQSDLKFVVESITKGHAEPFHAISQAKFMAEANRLEREIPRLSRADIIVRMDELVASIGDGHTRLPWPWDAGQLGFHQLPIQIEFFSDGVFIVAADTKRSELIGSQILKIGNMPIEKAVQAISPLVSRDNRFGIPRIARRILVIPEVLQATHIANRSDRVPVTVRKDGITFTRTLSGAAEPRLVSFHDLYGTPPPLHRSKPDRFYWKTVLQDGHTLYLQINAVSNQPGQSTLTAFCQSVKSDLDSDAINRVVVDLRHNGGGSRELMFPCIDGLASRERINKAGALFVVIGGETFSAAMWSALDFSHRTNATLVGQPTGGRPNFFGETRSADTPAERLHFTWASRMNWRTDHTNKSEALFPRITVTESFKDYSMGRDPVLSAILH